MTTDYKAISNKKLRAIILKLKKISRCCFVCVTGFFFTIKNINVFDEYKTS